MNMWTGRFKLSHLLINIGLFLKRDINYSVTADARWTSLFSTGEASETSISNKRKNYNRPYKPFKYSIASFSEGNLMRNRPATSLASNLAILNYCGSHNRSCSETNTLPNNA